MFVIGFQPLNSHTPFTKATLPPPLSPHFPPPSIFPSLFTNYPLVVSYGKGPGENLKSLLLRKYTYSIFFCFFFLLDIEAFFILSRI